ncbi:MAG: PKD domain-containing protein [Candidatus Thermoplasmatota archaeon]|jgi:hypothetical protein|nr:PKD domain-containing protein [Candidatus Thermoplasmatota archaeon]
MNPPVILNSRSLALLLTLLSVIMALGPVLAVPHEEGNGRVQMEVVPGRAGTGPLINRTVITVDYLHENFAGITDFLHMTGNGAPNDIFFDPNYQWKEGGGKNDDLPYGVDAFTATYPEPYDDQTTPIKLSIVHYYQDTSFGLVTLQNARNPDFNYEVYGEEFFIVKLTANNRSGTSEAELRFKILPVNDRPERITDKDFFSIWLNEDGTYRGINKHNEDPKVVFGDKRDPFDVITYSFVPMNLLAGNITITMKANGTDVLFTPRPDFCSPYLPLDHRLKGINYGKGWENYFALFVLNVSDQDGLYVLAPLYVYVAPQNDLPIIEPLTSVRVKEDAICTIQFKASDLDLPYEQELVFGTNATDAIYDRSGVQIIYQADYFWKREIGLLKFRTDNSMVGDYPVSAFTRDRSTRENGAPYDYPNSISPVYSNFTLSIVNENDPPRALIDEPVSTFDYNTSSEIVFNASRTTDMDLIHGDILNFSWYMNGGLLGYGEVISRNIVSEGKYNITLNVTDGIDWSLAYVNIIVKKAKVLGEIFEGKDLTRASEDNSSAIVIWKNQERTKIARGGQHSLDLTTISGRREGAIYKINVMFAEPLTFLFTDEVRNEPKLQVFFLKPGFDETQVTLDQQTAASYDFPVPSGGYRYSNSRMEFDLSIPQTTYPTQTITPRIRVMDNKMGVEITLTIVEMDLMDVKPDFVLYAIAEMKTTIKTSSGTLEDLITTWDSAGYGAKLPQVTGFVDGPDDDDDGPGNGLIILLAVLASLVIIIVIVGLVLFLFVFRKKEEKPQMTFQPEQSVDEMVFGARADQYAQRPTGPGYAGAPLPAGGALTAAPTPVEQVMPPPAMEQLPPVQVQMPPEQAPAEPPQALPAPEAVQQ